VTGTPEAGDRVRLSRRVLGRGRELGLAESPYGERLLRRAYDQSGVVLGDATGDGEFFDVRFPAGELRGISKELLLPGAPARRR
jgi:hypothetical protein